MRLSQHAGTYEATQEAAYMKLDAEWHSEACKVKGLKILVADIGM